MEVRRSIFTRLSLVLSLVLLICSLSACERQRSGRSMKTETYVGAPEFEARNVVIKEGVKTFGSAEGLISVQVEESSLIYAFNADAVPDINEGDLLVGEQGTGFIRRALAVMRRDNSIHVITERATLLDALTSADIELHFGPETTDEWSVEDESGGETTGDSDDVNEVMVVFEEDESPLMSGSAQLGQRTSRLLEEDAQFFKQLNAEIDYPLIGEVNNGLWLEGRLSTALDFDFTLSIRDGEVVSSESKFSGALQGKLTLKAGSTYELQAEREFEVITLRPIVVVGAVGFIPIVVTLTPKVVLSAAGSIGVNRSLFTAELIMESRGDATVRYRVEDEQWQSEYELSPPTFTARADLRGPKITNTVAAEMTLTPQVNIQFYESYGAKLKLPLSVNADVQTEISAEDQCADMNLDLTTSVLLTPESRWDWVTDLFEVEDIEVFETKLASAEFMQCEMESPESGGGSVKPPPGASQPGELLILDDKGASHAESGFFNGVVDSHRITFAFLNDEFSRVALLAPIDGIDLNSAGTYSTEGEIYVGSQLIRELDPTIDISGDLEGPCMLELKVTAPLMSVPFNTIDEGAVVDLFTLCDLEVEADDRQTTYRLMLKQRDVPVSKLAATP